MLTKNIKVDFIWSKVTGWFSQQNEKRELTEFNQTPSEETKISSHCFSDKGLMGGGGGAL